MEVIVMKHSFKKEISLLLAVLMVSATASVAAAPAPETEPIPAASSPVSASPANADGAIEGGKKTETVYVTLDCEGNPTEQIVTDWLHTNEAGAKLTDKSDLDGIENIKGEEVPLKSGDSLTWKLGGTDLYYRGTTQKQLPVSVSISYFLNGRSISPDDLAGKSGHVKIQINLKNNEAHTVDLNGKPATMYTPMMAVVGMILPEETFQNIEVSDGKLISDGSSQVAAFISIPGLDDSLNLKGYSSLPDLQDLSFPEQFTITADATEFEMGPIGFALTPSIPELDDMEGSNDFEEMKQDLYDLRDIQNNIEEADANRLVRSLFTDPAVTRGAQALTDDIFDFYDMDKALLDILPDYVTPENIALYDRVKDDAETAQVSALLDNEYFRGLPDRLTDENIEKARLLVADYDMLQELDMSKIRKAVKTLDDCDDVLDLVSRSRRLADRMADNKDVFNTLETLMKYGQQAAAMFQQFNDPELIAQLSSISDEEIGIMVGALVDHRAQQIAGKIPSELTSPSFLGRQASSFVQPVKDSGAVVYGKVAPSDRKTLAVCLAFAAEQTQNPALSQLIPAVQAGQVPPQYIPTVVGIVAQVQQTILGAGGDADAAKDKMTEEIIGVKDSLADLAASMGEDVSEEDVEKALKFLKNSMPDLKYLAQKLGKNDDELNEAEDLLNDVKLMRYLSDWGNKLLDMKADMDANAENLELLREALKEYDKPEVKAFQAALPDLMDDMDDARPIFESLKDRLKDPILNASLHNSPDTIKTLMNMKDDLEQYRNVAEIMRVATDQKNVDLAREAVEKLDKMESENVVDKSIEKLEAADELLARKDEYVALGKDYRIYTQAGDSVETDVKFIMKTDEIKKPEPVKAEPAVQQEDSGLWAKCKNFFQKLTRQTS